MEPSTLLVFGMLAVLVFLMFNSQRKRQRQVRELQSSLGVGQDIITTAGLHATVLELDETTMLLETAPGQASRWDRRAVASVVPASTQDDLPSTPPDGTSADRTDDTK